jgi:hypothetical protein
MGDSIKIDVAGVLVYAEQRMWEFFGKDPASLELAKWFKELQATAFELASSVQCVGMREPVPFDKIYQPTRLLLTGTGDEFTNSTLAEKASTAAQNKAALSILAAKAFERHSITVKKFLELDQNAIIFAGPGWGKTTFVQKLFRMYFRSDSVLPVLITLRRPTAIADLERFLDVADKITKSQKRDRTLLLVDGYDEVDVADRRRVSDLLLRYQALAIGTFYLTCREYYEVFQIAAREVRIDHFNRKDKEQFVNAFLSAFRSRQRPEGVIEDLESRGFTEFLSHPLLLTLACIVRTSAAVGQPRSALRLLDRALDVLCYRWDEQKGISRHQVTPLDGNDRIQVLKRLAHTIKSPFIPKARAMQIVSTQLDRMGIDGIDPRQVLKETAQFYGILAQREDGWEFVHRTIHDFLGAQFWVESGEFALHRNYEWNARTAYAACLSGDSTEVLERALDSPQGLPTVTEILCNAPTFDPKRIIRAVVEYFSNANRVVQFEEGDDRILGRLESDFLRLASTRFLARLFEHCCAARNKTTKVIEAYCAVELRDRAERLDHATYEVALRIHKSDRFSFIVPGLGVSQLGTLNPDIPKVPRLLREMKKKEGASA